MKTMEEVKVVFQPSGRRGRVKNGVSVIEASRELGVDIETLCGEKRVCGKCKIRVDGPHSGNLSPWQEEEARLFHVLEYMISISVIARFREVRGSRVMVEVFILMNPLPR